jgi:hypothetical protein
VFWLSIALLLHDVGCHAVGALRRWSLLVIAALVACVAVGSKESAIFVVPLAVVVAWQRAGEARAACLRAAPIAFAVFAWLCWRASCLGTWGSGTHYGWRVERVTAATCFDWVAVLLAPVHEHFVAPLWLAVLVAMHGCVLVLAFAAVRRPAVRRVLLPGLVLMLLGYLAGIGLERLDASVLENVRYSYEPVLGLCAVLGVGVATLPARARGVALALFVAVHAWVLDGNRESWLRAAAVYQRMQREVVELARTTREPVRVFDAPGVYEGAFAYLNGYTEFLFWQQTAAAGTDLRGGVASTFEWRPVLEQLAATAAAKGTVDARVVRWHDGALVPFVFDAQWPV